MLAKFESRQSTKQERVWIAEYQDLHNLPHWHLNCEFISVQEGKCTVIINDCIYHVRAGQSLFCGSSDVHSILGDAGSVIRVILFDPTAAKEITNNYCLHDPLLKGSYDISSVFDTIKEEIDSARPFYEISVEQYITELVVDVFRKERTTTATNTPPNDNIVRYKSLIKEIDTNYCFISFDDAANFMGLSRSYFSKLFHKLSGITFSRYLNIVRIEKAIEMLRDRDHPQTVTQIAEKCGFDSIRNFNRMFRNITGTNPKNLPRNFTPDAHKIISVSNSFNPTLNTTRIIYES